MLSQIRKFSSSIYAKIFLFIVAIPFVFWGMGPLFTGGNINTIAKIGRDNISTQEFINFLQIRAPGSEILDSNSIENFLYIFIGEKLLANEIKNFDIKLSNKSLKKTIKNEKLFQKENKFSRIEYEKFLVKNSIDAITLENNILNQNKKEQLLNFIGGGITPSNFLVNMSYDKINQERYIELINLNDIFKKKFNYTEKQIVSSYNINKNSYIDTFKTIKFVKLNPKKLVENDEYNDLFFRKIDEIDDLIAEGKNLDFILNKFNLEDSNIITFNKFGKDKNLKAINNFPINLLKNIFNTDDMELSALVEHKNNYIIFEIVSTENIQKKITEDSVKKEILLNLKKQTKRKLISEIISKINKNDFNKKNFYKLSNDENVAITKMKLENQNDIKLLKQEFINQIYAFPEKMVIVVTDIGLKENFLVYIDRIKNVSISKNSHDYNKYFNLSKADMKSSLFNTYDSLLKNKYKIEINYKTLDSIKNNIR